MREFRKKLYGRTTKKLRDNVTHLLTQAYKSENGQRIAIRTYKVIQCIILKIPLVDLSWLRASLDERKILPIDNFEILSDNVSDQGITNTAEKVRINKIISFLRNLEIY